MKKILIIILLIMVGRAFGQTLPTTPGVTSRSTLPVEDRYLFSRQHFGLPRYTDTSQANTYNGLVDSCGAMIYTYNYGLWYRACYNGGRRWVQVQPSFNPTVDTSYWSLAGNYVADRVTPPVLGTTTDYELPIITNDTQRLTIPVDGIRRNGTASYKYLIMDTTAGGSHYLAYGDASGGTTPTWQQTLTAGSTLNQTNTVLLSGDTMIWKNGKFWITASDFTNPYLIIDPTPGGDRYGLGDLNGNLSVNATSIYVDNQPGDIDIHSVGDFSINGQGNYYFTGLKTGLTPPTQIGTIKYVTTDQNGHFSFSDILTVPTWQETLDAGSSLNTNNTISMNGNSFIWSGNSFSSYEGTVGGWSFETLLGGFSFAPYNGKFSIDTLNNETFQNTLMGWTSTSGTNRGKVGYITIGSGLSLSSGVLTAAAAGITVGSSPIASGTSGRILFEGSGNVVQESANLLWDNTNGYLGLGGTPSARLQITSGEIYEVWNAGNPRFIIGDGVGAASDFGGLSWISASDALGIGVGGGSLQNIVISSGGNVGIGDATPASLFTVGSGDKFQVDGNGNIVKLNNVTTSFPSSNSSGVLTNDGSGTLTWATPYIAKTGTTTLTGNTIIDNDIAGAGPFYFRVSGSGNRYLDINKSSNFYGIGDLDGAVGNTWLKVDDANQILYFKSVAITGASAGDALTVVDPSTGEIGVAPNLAFNFMKENTMIYAKNGRLFAVDAGGNKTQISPHNDKGEWIYKSTDKNGVTTEINMIHLAELLEKVTGEKLIYKTKN